MSSKGVGKGFRTPESVAKRGYVAAFDENLLRVGRQIPKCPFDVKWAVCYRSLSKHNGMATYGYHL